MLKSNLKQNPYIVTYILVYMVFGICKKKKNGFISLASARHNIRIERVVYYNTKITKPLFYVGCFLPDFKICWGVLLIYLFVKYPISLKTRIKMAMKEFYIYVRLKGGIL